MTRDSSYHYNLLYDDWNRNSLNIFFFKCSDCSDNFEKKCKHTNFYYSFQCNKQFNRSKHNNKKYLLAIIIIYLLFKTVYKLLKVKLMFFYAFFSCWKSLLFIMIWCWKSYVLLKTEIFKKISVIKKTF